jgi:hypothetical protein
MSPTVVIALVVVGGVVLLAIIVGVVFINWRKRPSPPQFHEMKAITTDHVVDGEGTTVANGGTLPLAARPALGAQATLRRQVAPPVDLVAGAVPAVAPPLITVATLPSSELETTQFSEVRGEPVLPDEMQSW